jgi:hypothetical protein
MPENVPFVGQLASNMRAFDSDPPLAFQTALKFPSFYLDCKCCKVVHITSATFPDTSVLYRLILESSQIVNVADLFASFSLITETSDASRFYFALSELLLAGHIIDRPSRKRKKYLLERLCFSDMLIN